MSTVSSSIRLSSSGDGTDNSSSSMHLKKAKAGKTVKSRYMAYDGKTLRKASSSSVIVKQSPLVSTALDSTMKLPDRGRSPGRKSMAPQKFKVPTSGQKSYLDTTTCVLQSTLMEGHRIDPQCDLSAIYAENSSVAKIDTSVPKIEPITPTSTVSEDVLDQMESQTLLLYFLTLQTEKHNSKLEEEAERSLLIATEEKQKLQQQLNYLRRNVLIRRTEEEQLEFLEKQIEVLEPSAAGLVNFKKEYKTFASALDTTRHELPIKNFYIKGDKQVFLDEIQHHLLGSKIFLDKVTTKQSENAEVSNLMKKLQEVILEMDVELKRTIPDILEISSDVSKDVALHSQALYEQTHDMGTVKNWYFK
ncbi:HAUS augmin-like complex subunit 8 [Protopterus annectens]|uniref:HAUS augmin-like complex subunit 8 n=1 Tax=Protopterus annectens TaxID=7888 RepID=UPI001CFA0227|nr:HAUS augmin-like complex subunit 8 [Protopterus annectens]